MKTLYSHGALLSLPLFSLAERNLRVPQIGENALGAGVFFAYILSALYLTGCLVFNLVQCFSATGSPPDQARALAEESRRNRDGEEIIKEDVNQHIAAQDARRKGWAKYFVGLALISFTLLSYNMLAFLIVSYLKWAEPYIDDVLINLSSIRTGKCVVNIWKWATNSNLFRTFAEDLIKHPQIWLVVQLALLYSYAWNIWMAMIGYEREIRYLGTYFLLDQVLPVSFTQNLFCTNVMFEKVQPRMLHASSISTIVKLVVTVLYVIVLSCISATIDTPWFFLAVFSLRAILFAPYFLDRDAIHASKTVVSGGRHSIRRTNMWCMLILVGYGLFLVTRAQIVPGGESEPVEINYAAAALRHDFTVGVVSSVSFIIASK